MLDPVGTYSSNCEPNTSIVFSKASLILVGACWMASVKASSCSSDSSSTMICSKSSSAWVSVMAANTSGLDAIWVAWSEVMSAVKTCWIADKICAGSASLRVSRICSICSSVTGSFAGMSITGSGRVVVDESVSSNSVVSVVSSCGCVVSVGCSVSSGTVVSGISGTVVSGIVVSAGSTGSGTVSSGTVVDVSGSVVSGTVTVSGMVTNVSGSVVSGTVISSGSVINVSGTVVSVTTTMVSGTVMLVTGGISMVGIVLDV